MMIRRLALVSGLAVLSAVAFASQAGAQPVPQDVQFDGNITGACTFIGTTAGTLVKRSPTSPFVEAAGPNAGSPSFGLNGAVGRTTVNCTSGGQLTVSVPLKLAAPNGFNDSIRQAFVGATTSGSLSNSPGLLTSTSTGGTFPGYGGLVTAPITVPANTNTPLSVGMAAGQITGTPAPTGNYQYSVTLTATPN